VLAGECGAGVGGGGGGVGVGKIFWGVAFTL
jgi:hypothetical protein